VNGGIGAQCWVTRGAEGVSCKTKWKRGTMGEPTTVFIGSRREESGQETSGHRWWWDINGGVGFEAKKKREGSRGGIKFMGEMKMVGWHIGSSPSWCGRSVDSRAQHGGAIPATKGRG
jgi:hypothetical protein